MQRNNCIDIELKTVNRLEILNVINNLLKRNLCKSALENQLSKQTLLSKFMSTTDRKVMVKVLVNKFGLSIRRACKLFNLSRTAYYYNKTDMPMDEAQNRLIELMREHPEFGYWKLYHALRDEDILINHKRVYRIYKEFKNA